MNTEENIHSTKYVMLSKFNIHGTCAVFILKNCLLKHICIDKTKNINPAVTTLRIYFEQIETFNYRAI